METLEAIAKRHSVRNFSSQPLPRDVVEKIIDAGRRAPSGNNVQPWEFIVVTDSNVRKTLAEIASYGKFIADAPVCVAVYCKDTKYYLEDGCAAVENILLAATALGVGSCWVAGDKKPYCGHISQILGVPEGYKLIALIALGYEAGTPTIKSKRPLAEVLHWEKF